MTGILVSSSDAIGDHRGFNDTLTGLPLARWGCNSDGQGYRGLLQLKKTLIAAAGNGGMLSLANPFASLGLELVIDRLWCRLSAASGGAATMDVGVAANGSTSANTLLTGLSNITDKGGSGLNAPGVGRDAVCHGIVGERRRRHSCGLLHDRVLPDVTPTRPITREALGGVWNDAPMRSSAIAVAP